MKRLRILVLGAVFLGMPALALPTQDPQHVHDVLNPHGTAIFTDEAVGRAGPQSPPRPGEAPLFPLAAQRGERQLVGEVIHSDEELLQVRDSSGALISMKTERLRLDRPIEEGKEVRVVYRDWGSQRMAVEVDQEAIEETGEDED